MLQLAQHRQERISATMDQIRNGPGKSESQGLVLAATEHALWRQAASSVDPRVVCGRRRAEKPE